ncbi:MAG: diguanylate cyclase [Elusimicrobiota bacterium]
MRREEILIVNNDLELSKDMTKIMSAEGYKVIRAKNTEEVFSKLKLTMPKLILIDINVFAPEKKDIKTELEEYVSNASIPVIMMMDKEMLETRPEDYDFLKGKYLTKPLDPDELLSTVDTVLEMKRSYNEVSMTDPLTGLYNANFFGIQAMLFFNMAKRYDQVFSLIMMDVDGLKTINENYGIEIGDQAVKKVAFEIRKLFRNTDLVIKYSDDEFAILLPETNQKRSDKVMEKIRKSLQDKLFIYGQDGERIVFSVSIGMATYEDDMEHVKRMIELASVSMLKNKRRHIAG